MRHATAEYCEQADARIRALEEELNGCQRLADQFHATWQEAEARIVELNAWLMKVREWSIKVAADVAECALCCQCWSVHGAERHEAKCPLLLVVCR